MASAEENSAADLRNAVLLRMGPLDGCSYADGAVALLDEYVAKLQADWRRIAGWEAQWRAEHAIRAAVAALYEGKDDGRRRTPAAPKGGAAHPG